MKKKYSIISIIAILSLIVTACGSASNSNGEINANNAEPSVISIGSATSGGTVYTLALGVAELLKQEIEGVDFVAEETGGGTENFNLMSRGQIDIGHSPPDVALKAIAGTEPFQEELPLSLGWRFPDTTLHVAVRADSGIESFEDMHGKRISTGAAGGATFPVNTAVLRAHGLDEGDYNPAYLSFTESVEALGDGAIEVALIWGSVPTANVESLVAQSNVKLISVDPDKVAAIEEVPVQPDVIPAGTYNGIDEDITVTLYSNFAFINPELSEDLVYEMAKAIDNGTEALAQTGPGGGNIRIAGESDVDFIGIELHPGVKRYLEEKTN